MSAYRDALVRAAVRLGPSGESPSEIAVAARSACHKELVEFESANRDYVRWMYRKCKTVDVEYKADLIFKKIMCVGDEVVVNLIAEARAKKSVGRFPEAKDE